MKELILHMGLHKTGTSSIQDSFRANKEKLQRNGYHYPIFEAFGVKSSNHSWPLFCLFASKPENYHMCVRRGYTRSAVRKENCSVKKQLKVVLKTQRRVILSAEGLCNLAPKELNRLKKFIQKNGFTPTVYCSVRSPYSLTCSQIQENCKLGYSDLTKLRAISHIETVEKIQTIFPETHFFSFEDSARHQDGPVGYFMDLCGIPRTEHLDFKRSNGSLSNITCRLCSHLNQAHPTIVDNELNPHARNLNIKNYESERFLLTEAELKTILPSLKQLEATQKKLLPHITIDARYPTSQPLSIAPEQANEILATIDQPDYVMPAVYNFIEQNSAQLTSP